MIASSAVSTRFLSHPDRYVRYYERVNGGAPIDGVESVLCGVEISAPGPRLQRLHIIMQQHGGKLEHKPNLLVSACSARH